jgi:hypothetical protein
MSSRAEAVKILSPLRALKRIPLARRALARKKQQVLSRMLDPIPELAPTALEREGPVQRWQRAGSGAAHHWRHAAAGQGIRSLEVARQ